MLNSSIIGKVTLFALCLTVSAKPGRADTIILKNSDRLTGEIQKVEKDKLSLKTGYAGVVNIDWNMVDSISSERTYLIETGSGLRMEGIISAATDGLEIKTAGESLRVPVRFGLTF